MDDSLRIVEEGGGHRRVSVASSEVSDASFHSTMSVMVGGEHFGFCMEDLVTLEACVIEASDLMESRGRSGEPSADPCVAYFERELGELTRSFNALKVRATTIREDEVAHSSPLEDEEIQREGISLKSRIAGLLRELDEQEWSYGSEEEDFGDEDDEDLRGMAHVEGRLRSLELPPDDAGTDGLRLPAYSGKSARLRV
uniref:Uncharacterized protein n=1 Tax=Hemiselmis tepida TaxID=464990 RepID=A0A7S0VRM1_9CRYP|mmetsp:Transcript_25488/g.64763  ORF Transcript_25488/g.64763 Transcript_25488/m.64763 type:complete len:198 (+) Transcript_25488:428-1021(+)